MRRRRWTATPDPAAAPGTPEVGTVPSQEAGQGHMAEPADTLPVWPPGLPKSFIGEGDEFRGNRPPWGWHMGRP